MNELRQKTTHKINRNIPTVVCFLFLMLMVTPIISAFDFDNVHSYNEETRTALIENAFGLGRDIAQIRLITEQHRYVFIGEYVFEIEIENFGVYSKPITKMDLYRVSSNFEEIEDKQLNYKYFDGNKWIDFDNNLELPIGIIRLRAYYPDLKPGETIEWIPTLFGERIPEWADFTGLEKREFVTDSSLGGVTGNNEATPTNWIAQTFEIGKTIKLGENTRTFVRGVSINYTIFGGTHITVNISIVGVNSTDEPNMSLILNSVEFEVTSAGWINQTFPETVLNNATNYSLIISSNQTGIADYHISFHDGDVYAPGRLFTSTDSGGGWGYGSFGTGALDHDIPFYIFGANISEGTTVTLIEPADETSTISKIITFNCSATDNSEISNISLYINGTRNDTKFVGGGINKTSFNKTLIFGLGVYNWTCLVYDDELNKAWASANFTFNIDNLIENSQTFNETTFETAIESFILNISFNPNVYNSVSAILNYNGTDYVSEKTEIGQATIFSSILDIPLLIANLSQNKTFHWKIIAAGTAGTDKFNSTFKKQTVNPIFLGSCGAKSNITAINFTTADEPSLNRIAWFDFKGTFDYFIGDGTTMKTTSIDSSDIQEQLICINQNITFNIDAIIEYTDNGSTYVIRNYYFDSEPINNITKNITLYLLNKSDSTTFILKVVDQNQLDVKDAFIETHRFYPGIGESRIVQIAKTDGNGKSDGFFKTEDVLYSFVIKRNRTTELITSRQKIVPEETPLTLTFTIGGILEKPWADFDDLKNLDAIILFNKTSNITTFTYTDTSGNFTHGRLLVKKLQFNQTDIVICNITSTDSSASIICDASGFTGSFTAQGLIKRIGDERTVLLIQFTIDSVAQIMGLLGLFLAWFIILVSGMAFIWHPIAGIIGINVAVIFTNIMGLVSFSPLFIFGMIAVSVILIFVLKD